MILKMKKTTKKVWMVAFAAILAFPLILIVMAELKRRKRVASVGSDQARGIRNNNPLNLRRTDIDWKGEKKVVTDQEFEEFETMMWGLRAGLRNMKTNFGRGNNTIRKLISVWAPSSENNTENYIDIVSKETGINPDAILIFGLENMYPVVKSMCKIESNLDLKNELYEEAWANI